VFAAYLRPIWPYSHAGTASLMNKRLIGYVLATRRRAIHETQVLAA
jgi:hypothetical protein